MPCLCGRINSGVANNPRKMWNYNVCAIFLLDATFITDPAKFVSGALLSLSAMVQLELPHLNVLTKCDLADRSEVSTPMQP